MSIIEVKISSNARLGGERLDQVLASKDFEGIRTELLELRHALADLNDQPDRADASVEAAERVEQLYRSSVAETNARARKYQQPIFQCYGDYQKCVTQCSSGSGKALCVTLFVLSLADNLISISVSGG